MFFKFLKFNLKNLKKLKNLKNLKKKTSPPPEPAGGRIPWDFPPNFKFSIISNLIFGNKLKLISKNKKRRAFFYFSWDFPQIFKFLIFCNLNFVEINFLFWKLRAPWGPGSSRITSSPRPPEGPGPLGAMGSGPGGPGQTAVSPEPQRTRGPLK